MANKSSRAWDPSDKLISGDNPLLWKVLPLDEECPFILRTRIYRPFPPSIEMPSREFEHQYSHSLHLALETISRLKLELPPRVINIVEAHLSLYPTIAARLTPHRDADLLKLVVRMKHMRIVGPWRRL
ncbi:uncharacterized protein ARMOST_02188 [Armillaria ostoyae]|uniref:Uncharacterized protein n=1 Tax=Armillaria ostoyae TaxID=47428 RepID=A0A284QR01_ARMOS|nr:uncharacterized protein ARMOST_02188 [Armillaria ostoyae]